MHVPRWIPMEQFKHLVKRIATNMAQILHVSTRCQLPFTLQMQCEPADVGTAMQTRDASETSGRYQDNSTITEAYRLATIACARLQREAERHDHDLRLLVGHAKLLDRLTEKIEEVEPDFTLESLDPATIEPEMHSLTLSKIRRRARIENTLRSIDLSEHTDEEELDEVYDESDDDLEKALTLVKDDLVAVYDESDDDLAEPVALGKDDIDEESDDSDDQVKDLLTLGEDDLVEVFDDSDDDLEEPLTPEKKSLGLGTGFQAPLLQYGMVSTLHLPLNQEQHRKANFAVRYHWSQRPSHWRRRRNEQMPIIKAF